MATSAPVAMWLRGEWRERMLEVLNDAAGIVREVGSEVSKFKVGDEVFFETLKEYYNTYMFQNVNGAKFVDLWNKKGIDIDKIISEYK